MKLFTLFLTLLLVFSFGSNLFAVDEKKIEKKIRVKTTEKKSGLGVVVSTNAKDDTTKNIEDGAKIIEVFKGSEADAIGLKKGDLIVEFNGKKITKPSDLLDQMDDTEEGEEVSLKILRSGKEQSLKATLKPFSGHAYAFHTDNMDDEVFYNVMNSPHGKNYTKFFHSGDSPSGQKKGGYLGVQVKGLSDQLQKYFEVENGVLIEEVMKDSPAEKAGLKAGDVVTSINDRKIKDPEDLIRTINYFNPDEEVEVSYNRKGNKKETTTVLGQKPGFSWTTKKSMGPRHLEVIKEDDQDTYIIKGDNAVQTIDIMKADNDDSTEILKEILIF